MMPSTGWCRRTESARSFTSPRCMPRRPVAGARAWWARWRSRRRAATACAGSPTRAPSPPTAGSGARLQGLPRRWRASTRLAAEHRDPPGGGTASAATRATSKTTFAILAAVLGREYEVPFACPGSTRARCVRQSVPRARSCRIGRQREGGAIRPGRRCARAAPALPRRGPRRPAPRAHRRLRRDLGGGGHRRDAARLRDPAPAGPDLERFVSLSFAQSAMEDGDRQRRGAIRTWSRPGCGASNTT